MSCYHTFSYYYDRLTNNVSYTDRADYFCKLIEQYQGQVGLLLDLACGTGSLSVEFAKRGYEVIGVDGSGEMLSLAMQKAGEQEQSILFLCQDMAKLDLYGTIDVAICALDSLNHLSSGRAVQKTLDKVSLFLNPGGLFIFDVNSIYKHRNILGNNTFVIEEETIYCVWQNEFEETTNTVTISLDFFEKEKSVYYRSSECFAERAYSHEDMAAMVEKAGLELLAVYGDDSFLTAGETSERLIYVTRKR